MKILFSDRVGIGLFADMQRPDPNVLKELLTYKMPYGKYKDWRILDIPVYYLEWMYAQGFPKGKLGMMLSTAHIIKTNGLEHLVNAK